MSGKTSVERLEKESGVKLPEESTNYTKFENLSVIKNSGKEEELRRCSEPSTPLKPLLRTLSELEPMASNDSLSKRYMRIFSVVALYWQVKILGCPRKLKYLVDNFNIPVDNGLITWS